MLGNAVDKVYCTPDPAPGFCTHVPRSSETLRRQRAQAPASTILAPPSHHSPPVILYRNLSSLQEYLLVDPADRRVEIFTLADPASQRWAMVDRTGAPDIVLASINLVLPTEVVFRGVEATP